MTFVIENGNGKWCLEPKTDHDGTYYEVYTHSDYETFGEYVGDFETIHKRGTLEFEKEFTDWINCN